MKIAFFELQGEERAYVESHLGEHTGVFIEEELSERTAEQAAECEAVSVFIYSQVSEAVLAQLPQLRFVTTRSTGFDHIDLPACAARGVKVSNVPFYGENTVAEHTFALILALSRNVHKSYVRTLRGD